jgi:2'-5' RNA ligase
MQTVCTRLREPYWQRVLDYRDQLAEDPLLGAIFDPPTAHCSHVLAEDLDWDGLAPALEAFARTQKPFVLRTRGVLCFTGELPTIVVNVVKDARLAEYHAALYEVASKFAVNGAQSYAPATWKPHVTIKRCPPDAASFGGAMAKLAAEPFDWQIPIDAVSAQYDLGGSEERVERLRFPLTG